MSNLTYRKEDQEEKLVPKWIVALLFAGVFVAIAFLVKHFNEKSAHQSTTTTSTLTP